MWLFETAHPDASTVRLSFFLPLHPIGDTAKTLARGPLRGSVTKRDGTNCDTVAGGNGPRTLRHTYIVHTVLRVVHHPTASHSDLLRTQAFGGTHQTHHPAEEYSASWLAALKQKLGIGASAPGLAGSRQLGGFLQRGLYRFPRNKAVHGCFAPLLRIMESIRLERQHGQRV